MWLSRPNAAARERDAARRQAVEANLAATRQRASPKLRAAQIRDLAALRWLSAGESVVLYGPSGTG
jgi:DNA replication protein DnaC